MNKNYTELLEYLELRSIPHVLDADLSQVSWAKMGGRADVLVRPSSAAQLSELVCFLYKDKIDFRIFGNTSNCYFSEGHHGCVITTRQVKRVSFNEESGLLEAECGANLTLIAKKTGRSGWAGFEGMVGIPATIGGAVFMNAGSYQNVISQTFVEVKYVSRSGELKIASAHDMGFAYRTSAFKRRELEGVIVSAKFQLKAADATMLSKRIEDVTFHRINFQEKKYINLGTLSCTPTFYREIFQANPLFGLVFGPVLAMQRVFFKLREKLFKVPFPPKRTMEIRLIKYWFRYPLLRRVHSDYSLNCFITNFAEPGDFEIYTEWLLRISKGRIELENEYIKAHVLSDNKIGDLDGSKQD